MSVSHRTYSDEVVGEYDTSKTVDGTQCVTITYTREVKVDKVHVRE
ncbi:hypothetical protein [Halovivax cerinus]|uniref:Uncharacterized protein n=1 Tax=Halovivax cerinus TaxID=1487865 RepID=A0ABD5NPM5_9EURY|nr:hypothetical protein [Halovivax cerinus]